MKLLLIIAAVTVLLFAVNLFLIFPSLKNKRKTKKFFTENSLFAHRGLFDNRQIPENSMAAFQKAAESGYGIELDTHITSDGKIVVFHDDDLNRMCGIDKKPEEMTAKELTECSLMGTDERIPLFEDVLKLINGRSALIVEVKGTSVTDVSVCEKTAAMLEKYNGEYCIESFNPVYVRYFKKHLPSVIRGQLSGDMSKQDQPFILRFALERLLLNFMSRPDFAAYDMKISSRAAFKTVKLLGCFPIAWTVRSPRELEEARGKYKGYIFEGFLPRI